MLFDELSNFLNQGIQTSSFFINNWCASHERHEGSISVLNAYCCRSLTSFNDNLDLTVFLFLRLQNPPQRTDAIDLVRCRFIDCRIVLSSEKDCSVGCERLLKRAHRTRPSDLEGDFSKGKYDDIADRYHRIPGNIVGGSVGVFFHGVNKAFPGLSATKASRSKAVSPYLKDDQL